MLHTFSVAAPCHQQWVGKSPGLVYSVQSWGQASAAQPTRWYHKSTEIFQGAAFPPSFSWQCIHIHREESGSECWGETCTR